MQRWRKQRPAECSPTATADQPQPKPEAEDPGKQKYRRFRQQSQAERNSAKKSILELWLGLAAGVDMRSPKNRKQRKKKLTTRSFCVLVACKIAIGVLAARTTAIRFTSRRSEKRPAISWTATQDPARLSNWRRLKIRSLRVNRNYGEASIPRTEDSRFAALPALERRRPNGFPPNA